MQRSRASFFFITAATFQESCNRRMPSWLRNFPAFFSASLFLMSMAKHHTRVFVTACEAILLKLFYLVNVQMQEGLRHDHYHDYPLIERLLYYSERRCLPVEGKAFRPLPPTCVPRFRFVYNRLSTWLIITLTTRRLDDDTLGRK